MPKRVFCKFFAQGACLKGEHCGFSHDWNDQISNVCMFYQKGQCSYGNRCRYDHIKVTLYHTSVPSSTNSCSHEASDSVQATHISGVPSKREQKTGVSSPAELSALSKPFLPSGSPASTGSHETHTLLDGMSGPSLTSVSLAEQPICSFAAAGNCPNGERCPHIHGDLCSICGKHCLHPFRLSEREEHIKLCQKNNMRLEALRRSQEIECSVCFDRVLSKPTASERKFGLLSECDHPFCISCIRKWRSNSSSSGMDVNTALRACPVCRKLSHFVIPSIVWYSTQEEKQEIVDSYKAKLRSIDCKYFDFGNCKCPFGSSCFYKHEYKPHRNRPRGFKPHTYRPRRAAMDEVEVDDLVRQLALEDELEELAGELAVEGEDFESPDEEDVDISPAMSFELLHWCFYDSHSSSDADE